jgi:hypothetical protein
MNLRRGLLRFWVVLSLAWIIAVGVHGYLQLGEPGLWGTYQVAKALVGSNPFDKRWPATATQEEKREEMLEKVQWLEARIEVRPHLAWAFGPPLAVLIIGAALGWAVAGFRRK